MFFASGKKAYLVFMIVVAVFLSVVLVYGNRGLMHLKELRLEEARLKEANEDLVEQNRRLMRHIDRIKKDPRYIEDEARKKLGLIRPNETIYRLEEEPDVTGNGVFRN